MLRRCATLDITSIHPRKGCESALVQREPEQPERGHKVRVKIGDARRRALIEMADARDLQEQMREITARIGGTIAKIGEGEEPPPAVQDPERR